MSSGWDLTLLYSQFLLGWDLRGCTYVWISPQKGLLQRCSDRGTFKHQGRVLMPPAHPWGLPSRGRGQSPLTCRAPCPQDGTVL